MNIIGHCGAVQKCSEARRTKNRAARRMLIYVKRCGLQRNTADERIVKPSAFSGKEGD
jgi:hypothetical protein